MFSPLPAPTFPFYLLPSIPFRRRPRPSATPTTTSSSTPQPTPYLTGSRAHLRCSRCLTDLCLSSQIISKGFTGRHGRAYLVAPSPSPSPSSHHASTKTSSSAPGSAATARSPAPALPNTHLHRAVPRMLVTGAHTVSDVSCAACGAVLGWKYVGADDEAQRYKVGKYILETRRVCRGVCWENQNAGQGTDDSDGEEGCGGGHGGGFGNAGVRRGSDTSEEDEVEFDSQDEDECEDLFAGVWSPELARKRRRGKAWREGGMAAEEV